MHTTFKKLLALAMCAVMVVGVLVACCKSPAEETSSTPTNDYPTVNAGVLVLNTGALLSIRYDVDGNVNGITGDNDSGLVIMDEYTGYEGKATKNVVKELIALSAAKEALTKDISTVLLKITSGNVFADEQKHNDLVKAAQDALTEAKSTAIAMLIDKESLTAEGYLTLATVKTLIMHKLGVDKFDAFYGDTLPTNNVYLVTAEVSGVRYSCSVDAYNGFISIVSQEDLLGNSNDENPVTEPVETESTEFVEETETKTDPTPAPYQPIEPLDTDIEIPVE